MCNNVLCGSILPNDFRDKREENEGENDTEKIRRGSEKNGRILDFSGVSCLLASQPSAAIRFGHK